MTANPTSKTALDGVSATFPAGMALESVSGNFAQTTYIKEPAGETLIVPAQDGVDGTGITPPTGGSGIRGWESGIYKLLQGPISFSMSGAQVTNTPTVTVGSYVSGNVIGGIMSFPLALNPLNMGKLVSLTLRFKATVQTTSAFKVALFTASPSGTFADHGNPTIAVGDSAILLDIFTIAAASAQNNLGTHTIYNLDNIGKKIVGTSTSLFAVVVCSANLQVNPATTSEMSLTVALDW